jgi:chemotaxis family two-component system response regulator Rcp1
MNPHVMIIDDSADQVLLMKAAFKMVDPLLTVTTIGSCEEALDLLTRDPASRPKVILSDLRMRGKDGREFLKEIKADPVLRVIPVCVFSNGEIEADICDCYASGASFYFKKPLGLDALKTFLQHFKSLWFDFAAHCPTP